MNNDVKRILVIDDEPDILELFKRILADHIVLTATDEETAIELIIKEGKFDVIFMDMVIPDTNSTGLYTALKKVCPDSRVILMTGYAVEDDIAKLRKMGVSDIIHKPFSHINDIRELVKN